jgi:hypothetical protein
MNTYTTNPLEQMFINAEEEVECTPIKLRYSFSQHILRKLPPLSDIVTSTDFNVKQYARNLYDGYGYIAFTRTFFSPKYREFIENEPYWYYWIPQENPMPDLDGITESLELYGPYGQVGKPIIMNPYDCGSILASYEQALRKQVSKDYHWMEWIFAPGKEREKYIRRHICYMVSQLDYLVGQLRSQKDFFLEHRKDIILSEIERPYFLTALDMIRIGRELEKCESEWLASFKKGYMESREPTQPI